MSLFLEDNPWVFLLLTVVLGGGAAFLAGRSLAKDWRPGDLARPVHDSARRRGSLPAFRTVPAPVVFINPLH